MSRQLPEQPNLEHLKNEAKALLRQAKAGDPEAVNRVAEPKLAGAQLAIAREYGFPSWAKLKRHVEGFANRRTAFFAAVRAGDRELVSELLADDPGLVLAKDPGSFDAPPLNLAANRNDRALIDLLLRAGADVDARSSWWAGGFGPLDFGDDETGKYLLSRGATLTPHAAARLGMVEELRQMIAADPAVVNERGGDGQMPLHFAESVEVVDLLLNSGADIDARDIDHEGTPAQHHVLKPDLLRKLVERGASVDVFMAIARDDADLVARLVDEDPGVLDRRTDEPGNPMIPQAPGWHIYTYNLGFVRPFQAAANLGSERSYNLLFERSSPSLKLLSACWKGDGETAHTLARERPQFYEELGERDQTMLGLAVRMRKPEACRVMLELGFDPNQPAGEGMIPIAWAAFLGYDEIVELMLPYKPNLEHKNNYGGTVMSTCIYGSVNGWGKDNDHARCVELLAAAGAVLPERLGGTPQVREVLKRLGVKD